MKHLITKFNELTPEEQADFIRFYTGGDGNLTEEEKQEQNQAEKQKFNRTRFLIMAFVYMMLTATFVFYFKIGELTEAKEIVRRICTP